MQQDHDFLATDDFRHVSNDTRTSIYGCKGVLLNGVRNGHETRRNRHRHLCNLPDVWYCPLLASCGCLGIFLGWIFWPWWFTMVVFHQPLWNIFIKLASSSPKFRGDFLKKYEKVAKNPVLIYRLTWGRPVSKHTFWSSDSGNTISLGVQNLATNKTYSTYCWWQPEIWRSPVDMVNISSFTGIYTSQVVQDFFHQQCHHNVSCRFAYYTWHAKC